MPKPHWYSVPPLRHVPHRHYRLFLRRGLGLHLHHNHLWTTTLLNFRFHLSTSPFVSNVWPVRSNISSCCIGYDLNLVHSHYYLDLTNVKSASLSPIPSSRSLILLNWTRALLLKVSSLTESHLKGERQGFEEHVHLGVGRVPKTSGGRIAIVKSLDLTALVLYRKRVITRVISSAPVCRRYRYVPDGRFSALNRIP